MAAKREIRHIGALAGVMIAAALAIVFNLGGERLKTAHSKIIQLQQQNEKLRQSISFEVPAISLRDQLQRNLVVMKTRYYSPNEMNPYTFGTLIKKKLGSLGLTVVRYQVIELRDANSLEFSVSGPIGSLVLFLKEASESERYWSISSLVITMRESTASADAVFRIGYEVRDF
ncbi:MAG: hypothetical protein ABSG63_06500 [Spirochaetia bacterium]|jgi:hypothetical protein